MNIARKRVLVVEDDADVREAMVELLELLGHRVRWAATGEEAVAILVADELDVAFVDLGLPDISGHEVAQRVRSSARSRAATMIALSGWSQPADLARSRASGFELHLAKPVGSAELRRVVGDASGSPPPVGWRTIADECDRSRASSLSTTCACSAVTKESSGPLASPPTIFRT